MQMRDLTRYGARPLKRAIQTQIENPLAETLLIDQNVVDKEVVKIDVCRWLYFEY